MIQVIVITYIIIATYVIVSFFDRKFRVGHDVVRDLKGVK